MSEVNEYSIRIPDDLIDLFLEEWTFKLKSKWIFRCMDNGYGPIRVRQVREEYIDGKGVYRCRVVGHEIVFTSSEMAVDFKLRYM